MTVICDRSHVYNLVVAALIVPLENSAQCSIKKIISPLQCSINIHVLEYSSFQIDRLVSFLEPWECYLRFRLAIHFQPSHSNAYTLLCGDSTNRLLFSQMITPRKIIVCQYYSMITST
jgi:hypothetical protein